MPRTARLRPTRRTRHLTFPTIEVVGGLLSPDIVARVAEPASDAATRKAYGIPEGLELRDEIARAFRMAEAQWSRFDDGHIANPALANTFVPDFLKSVFGFDDLAPVPPVRLGERVFPIGHAAGGGKVPMVVAPATDPGRQRTGLDVLHERFADGGRRRSATQLLQEYLNADEACLWGIATDGRTLRLMRDNLSLTRPAHVDVDLTKMFRDRVYSDFSALWLLIHRSRFGLDGSVPSDCPLERWREQGKEQGVAARENLRAGVEAALALLGQGAIEHPDNVALRDALASGVLSPQGFYEELLGVVYRLIFLFAAEDRDLLHPPETPEAARRAYAAGYAVGRLRERAVHRTSWNRHHDAWDGLRAVFRALIHGAPAVGLPGLGGLFDPGRTPNLDGARIGNRPLMEAIFRLAWIRPQGQSLARVNWRDMQTEELGSVYEGLLELIPEVNVEARTFGFRAISGAAGSERKSSGSYYTPDALVRLVLDKTLDPLLDQAAARPDPVEAILNLTVLDPACGSGHFLLGAARRMAGRIVALEDPAAAGAASTDAFQHALRRVVSRCIYGVDRNPLAVELCKVALWIEALEPGRPLSFLDHRIVCGDSLIGVFDLSVLHDGIPDEAYKPLDGDDREVANHYKAKNKREMAERDRVEGGFGFARQKDLARDLAALADMPEETVEQVADKRSRFEELTRQGGAAWTLDRACDLWTSAFFARKVKGGKVAGSDGLPRRGAETVATSGTPGELLRGRQPFGLLTNAVAELACHYRFFHWPIAFADAMGRGGFDVVLGNPPWETMSPDYKEFFSTYDSDVRFMAPPDQRAAVARLLEHPGIAAKWERYCRDLYAVVHFMKASGRYRLFAPGNLGKGDFNVYRMFVETALAAARHHGVAAQFVPEGLYNGANATAIRKDLFDHFRLTKLGGFENTKEIWFKRVDSRTKFCLYVAWKSGRTDRFAAAFRINTMERLQDFASGKSLSIPVPVVAEFSPDAMAVMEFAAQSEIDVCAKMYGLYPKFGAEIEGLPFRHYMAEVHMGNDRGLFSEDEKGLPVFEGRMIDAYDYRAKGYVSGRGRSAVWEDLPFGSAAKRIQPQWRILPDSMPDKLAGRINRYRIGFGDVASPTNQRGLCAALVPPLLICGDKVPTIIISTNDRDHLLWLGVANALAMDFLVRKKVSLKMSYTVMDSLPFPRDFDATPSSEEIARRVCALCAVGPEMKAFREAAVKAGILRSVDDVVEDPARRAVLAGEVDVLVARDVYGLTRDEMLYMLDPANILGENCSVETFKALRNREIREFGEYRTQRLILEAWDRVKSGQLNSAA